MTRYCPCTALFGAALALAACQPARAQMAMMDGMLGHYGMTLDASGTAWQPASTPMAGPMWSSGGWSGMAEANVALVYDHQSGPRGDDQVFSESMGMVMAQRGAGPGTLTLKAMGSLDPAMGPRGYPLLVQTGETADGRTALVDRQHPHNLLMELGAVYSLPLGEGTSAFLYLAYPGEPALGPATFMHRASGRDDPAAPITHHWLDSTHITFGVATAGLVHGPVKIEASWFNGREPDQHRWGFQPLRMDSWSARATLNPTRNLSLQISRGHLASPEQLEPEVSQDRLTASATWNRKLLTANWQTTLAWGRNTDHPGHRLDGFLLESALHTRNWTLFARAERVTKDDLVPGDATPRRVAATSLGMVWDHPIARNLMLGLGVVATRNAVPADLAGAYGSAYPAGIMPFVRLKLL